MRLTLTLPFDLSASNRNLDPCIESPTVGGQIGFTIGGNQCQRSLLARVNHVFQFARDARKPVQIPTDDGVEASRPIVPHHALVVGSMHSALAADAVVLVGLNHSPALVPSDLPACLLVALDSGPLASAVEGSTQIDRGPT